VTHVLSILGPNSPDPPEFTAFAPHRRLILRFHDVIEPQPDQIARTREERLRASAGFAAAISSSRSPRVSLHGRGTASLIARLALRAERADALEGAYLECEAQGDIDRRLGAELPCFRRRGGQRS